MIFYVNGDSHSAGVSLDSQSQSFGSLVARHFNLDVVNQSLPGGSNQRTIRITQDWIRTTQQKYFILIGWTSWEREEWLYRGDFFQVNSGSDCAGDEELEQKYRSWVTGLSPEYVPQQGKIWHENIWQFHQKLQVRNIPHLFFNCFYDFFVDESKHLDWQGCFFHPYENDWSYQHYLKAQGHKTFGQDQYHYGPQAHQAWADLLINHIKENKLL